MLKFKLPDGRIVRFVMPLIQAKRLKTTCFRGRTVRRAGNFFAWNCFRDFIADDEVREKLGAAIVAVLADDKGDRDRRIQLEFAHDVGWDSVMEIDQLYGDEKSRLVYKPLNNHANAYFAPPEVEALKTELVTIVVTLKLETTEIVCLINTIYPGEDCGHLEGEMTEERGLVWLGWDNPGEE